MKYQILRKLKEHLQATRTPNTAKKYYQAVKSLLDGLQFTSIEQISAEELGRRLAKLKTSNDVSAAKNGLLALAELYPGFGDTLALALEDAPVSKRNRAKRTFEPVTLDTIKRRINSIQDVRTKTAFRFMLVSGLRVSEVGAVRKEDLTVTGEAVTVFVRNGKGGKDRTVECLEDTYTRHRLLELLEKSQPQENLFPSAATLQRIASQRNFECHDLRRAFAKLTLQEKKKVLSVYEANGQLMNCMGHVDFRTTKKYLRRKIEI